MTLSATDAVPAPAASSGTVGGLGRPRRTSRVPPPFRPSSLCISLSILLLALLDVASAQLDPVKNFCRRWGHQTAVVDRTLYIDGGFLNYNPLSQYSTNYSNTGLHYLDLDTPGTARMPQLYANLSKNATIPSVHGGALWADNVNKRFYLFGGEYYQQPPSQKFTLWSFDTLYKTWESFGSPDQDAIAAVSYGAGVSVSELGRGYYYGGWKSNNTVPGMAGPPVAQSGMVKYSMDTNVWSTDLGPDSVGRAEGAMVFIPIGDGGMMVYFGGVQDPQGNGTWVGQPMETIFLYDVLSGKWYSVNATGTVPSMRRRFCAGATWAADQSSYNIYLYGGAGMPPDTSGFDDVYALSIPSFQWIKMFPTDGNFTGDSPHHSLSCNVIDNTQMIVMGGTFPTSDHCDVPEQYGVHNMDLSERSQDKALWQIFVTNITQYTVPDPILSVIGGSPAGGATKTAPATGFNNHDLRVLMTRKATLPTRTPTRSLSTATDTPGQTTPLSPGALAGIIVGGVAFLIILAVAIFLIYRHRNPKTASPLSTHPPYHPNPKPPGSSNTPPAGGGGGSPPSLYTNPTDSTYLSLHYHHPQHHHHRGRNNPYTQQLQQQGYPVELPAAAPGSGNSWMGADGVPYYELVQASPTAAAHLPAGGSTAGGGSMAGAATTGSTTMVSVGESSGSAAGGEEQGMNGLGIGMGGSYAGGGGGGESPAKIDAEGRVWVQLPPGTALGGGSPGGNYHHAGGESPAKIDAEGKVWVQLSPATVAAGSLGGGSPGGRYHLVQQGQYAYSPGGVGVVPGENHHRQPSQPQELSTEVRREGGGGGEWDGQGRPKHHTFYHP